MCLNHFLDILILDLVNAHVEACGAELAVALGLVVPVGAYLRRVDTQVRPLQHAHHAHRGAASGLRGRGQRLRCPAHRERNTARKTQYQQEDGGKTGDQVAAGNHQENDRKRNRHASGKRNVRQRTTGAALE